MEREKSFIGHICHHIWREKNLAIFVTVDFAGRPTATSIAVVVNWTANFLVGLGFLPMRVSFLGFFQSQEFLCFLCVVFAVPGAVVNIPSFSY